MAESAAENERDAALESLLKGGHTDRLVADRLGVDASMGFFLAALRPLADDSVERMAASRRLLAITRSFLEAYRITSAITCVGDTLYVLFPCPDTASRKTSGRVLTDLHTRLQQNVPHRAMVSGRYAVLSETPSTRAAVDDLLALAEQRGWTGIIDSEAVQSAWRLEQFGRAARAYPTLLEGPIARLVEYDRDQSGDLVDTLKHWFACIGDARLCAERMGLHGNTVRYRIRRVEEVAGVSLSDPDDRLLLELQVRLLVR
jgi:sugar diacid utilization regulator